MHFVHEELIHAALAVLAEDVEVSGVMLQGSLARGDGYSTSDLDLFVLLRDGCRRSFAAQYQQDILVEHHAYDWERAAAKVRANPMLAYGFTDGRVLRDDTGGMAELVRVARDVIAAYRILPAERAGILYWLESARVKIRAAQDAGDLLKASFVVATTSWKILEGMWAVNDLPMPPSGAVLAHRHDLTRVPGDWEKLFQQLFQGSTAERASSALALIDWLRNLS